MGRGERMIETASILWTILALSYCLAGVHLRAFDKYDHPFWVWGSFLFVGSTMFMMVNHEPLLGDVAHVGSAFEIATIIAAAVLGHTLFVAARERARIENQNQTLEAELSEYRRLIEYHDIDIDDDPEQTDD